MSLTLYLEQSQTLPYLPSMVAVVLHIIFKIGISFYLDILSKISHRKLPIFHEGVNIHKSDPSDHDTHQCPNIWDKYTKNQNMIQEKTIDRVNIYFHSSSPKGFKAIRDTLDEEPLNKYLESDLEVYYA